MIINILGLYNKTRIIGELLYKHLAKNIIYNKSGEKCAQVNLTAGELCFTRTKTSAISAFCADPVREGLGHCRSRRIFTAPGYPARDPGRRRV